MQPVQSPPFFSVVIPLYNKENYIADTLKSVLSQCYEHFEIVLINDGSTDNSLSIAESVLQDFDAKTVVSQTNQGLSATRNRGIELSKGDIIAFLDADDIWHTDYLETVVNLSKRFPSIDVYGTYYSEYYSEKTRLEPKLTLDTTLKSKHFIIDDFFSANLGQPIINPSTLACKRLVLQDLSFNENVDYAEDIDFYINCFTKHKIAYAYEAKCSFRINIPNQITKSDLAGKTIPDFDYYKKNTTDKSLIRYISFLAYNFASRYKYGNDSHSFKRLLSIINFSDLNWKQRMSLHLPRPIYILLKNTKSFLISKGIKITTY